MCNKISVLCIFILLLSMFLPIEKGSCRIIREIEYTSDNECMKSDLEKLELGFNCAQYAKLREEVSYKNVKTIFLNNQVTFEEIVKTLIEKRKYENADYSAKDNKISFYSPYVYETYKEIVIQEMLDVNQKVADFFQLTDKVMPYLSSPEKEKKIMYRYNKISDIPFNGQYDIRFRFDQGYFGIYFELAYISTDCLLTDEQRSLQKLAPCWYYKMSDDKIRLTMY